MNVLSHAGQIPWFLPTGWIGAAAHVAAPLATVRAVFRTWTSMLAMLPAGGTELWRDSFVQVLGRKLDMTAAIQHLLELMGPAAARRHHQQAGQDEDQDGGMGGGMCSIGNSSSVAAGCTSCSNSTVHSRCSVVQPGPSSRTSQHRRPATRPNPLTTPLPFAPSHKMYCLYGVGLETQVAFTLEAVQPASKGINRRYGPFGTGAQQAAAESPTDLQLADIHYGEGDGTVPIQSLGYMCRQGWKQPHLNPANMTITTREYAHAHKPWWHLGRQLRTMSGHADGSGHVEILANHAVHDDVINIITGRHSLVTQRLTVSAAWPQTPAAAQPSSSAPTAAPASPSCDIHNTSGC